ncbi:hypothetical protein [Pinisolibacter aquiterrae]|uniref:hypothetical protein n=1 Tax=Pinisolibacter aquiterrae TaxID=2815579 RepID=UPI001C3CDC99|nr:hypothetical protein [Pinisolibacter aquiterrae]MBV5263237.1 hypothetical protein [Pinisolibacter aquiterrae]MCC8234151.1 hypothetical protein [Pinisolibacter aquiterrae]
MAKVLINDQEFKTSLPYAALKAARSSVSAAFVLRNELETAYAQAVAAGQESVVELLRMQRLTHPACVLAAALDAGGRRPVADRPTLEMCFKIRDTLKLGQPIDEVSVVRVKAKPAGGHRCIHTFGPIHRTQQEIVRRVLTDEFEPRSFQYALRGVHAAVLQVQNFLKAGYVHMAQLDISDFFGHFELEKLAPELPLPWEVVEHAVVGRHIVMAGPPGSGSHSTHGVPHPTYSPLPVSIADEARLGLPQGSICSPIVTELCLSRLPWSPTPAVKLVNYVDNFLLLATDEGSLQEEIEKLKWALAQLPGGTFSFKPPLKKTGEAGMVFLGHIFQVSNGELHTLVGYSQGSKLLEMESALTNHIGFHYSVSKKIYIKEKIIRYYAYIKNFGVFYKHSDDAYTYIEIAMETISSLAKNIGISISGIKKASTQYLDSEKPEFSGSGIE